MLAVSSAVDYSRSRNLPKEITMFDKKYDSITLNKVYTLKSYQRTLLACEYICKITRAVLIYGKNFEVFVSFVCP